MKNAKDYLKMLNEFYLKGTTNHGEHNSNPLYWNLLLKDIKENPSLFENKIALDFGCGKGRNITNMLSLADFARVDGVDVSVDNINSNNANFDLTKSNFYKNNGEDLSDLKSNEYDFIMSTIVLQHICVHEIRYNIKKEIFRILKKGGIFSFQMGYDTNDSNRTNRDYYDNGYDATTSNGGNDTKVTDPQQLVDDLTKIGFTDITFEIHEPYSDVNHTNWIYVRCKK